MLSPNAHQRVHLLDLAASVANQPEPLGIGLHNGCWGGVAANIATAHEATVQQYYGLTFRQFKDAIKCNNQTHQERRNGVMALRTLRMASSLA